MGNGAYWIVTTFGDAIITTNRTQTEQQQNQHTWEKEQYSNFRKLECYQIQLTNF